MLALLRDPADVDELWTSPSFRGSGEKKLSVGECRNCFQIHDLRKPMSSVPLK